MSDTAFSWAALLHQFDRCEGAARNQEEGFDEHPSASARQQISQLNFEYRLATNCAPAQAVSNPGVDCSFTQTSAAFADLTGCEAPPAAAKSLEIPTPSLWTLGEVPPQTKLVTSLWGDVAQNGLVPSLYWIDGQKFALFSENGSETAWSGFFSVGTGTYSKNQDNLQLKLKNTLISVKASIQKQGPNRVLSLSDGQTELILLEWVGVDPNQYHAPPAPVPTVSPGDVPLENSTWTIVQWDSLDALKAIWPLNASKASLCSTNGNCKLQFSLLNNGTLHRALILVSGFAWSYATYQDGGSVLTFTGSTGKVLSASKTFESSTTLILTTPFGAVRLQRD